MLPPPSATFSNVASDSALRAPQPIAHNSGTKPAMKPRIAATERNDIRTTNCQQIVALIEPLSID